MQFEWIKKAHRIAHHRQQMFSHKNENWIYGTRKKSDGNGVDSDYNSGDICCVNTELCKLESKSFIKYPRATFKPLLTPFPQLKLLNSLPLSNRFSSLSSVWSQNVVNWMNINSNYRIILHPSSVPIICFRMFNVNDETCMTLVVINQITAHKSRAQRQAKGFSGLKWTKLIMRRTKADLWAFRKVFWEQWTC